MPRAKQTMDGNTAAAHVAYAYTDVAAIYPITHFSGMLDEFIEAEIKSTDDYLETLAKLGRPAPEISPHLKHIIVTAMFNGFFEIIIHNMPSEEAESYLKELILFFEAGWSKIMGQ